MLQKGIDNGHLVQTVIISIVKVHSTSPLDHSLTVSL